MKKKDPIVFIFITSLILGAGFLLATIHTIWHAPEYVSAVLTKVEHPIHPNYDEYNLLLHDVVKGEQVDYKAVRGNPHLQKALDRLACTACDEFPTDADKLLYWVNAYNLLVVKTISDRFPIFNYKAVTNDLSSRRFTVGGQALTVKDLRQLKIQPLLQGSSNGDATDCRMLMLICGGAMGFPCLCDHALTAEPERLKKDMEEATHKFLLHRRNLYYDKTTVTLLISPFFQWYDSLFQQSFDEPWDFAIYYNPKKQRFNSLDFHLKRAYNTRFDWRINDIASQD